MGNRLSKIVTRTGDEGTTGLGDGSRVAKDAARIEAIGCVDELNSWIGLLIASAEHPDVDRCLLRIQHDLFDLGGELAIPGHTMVTAAHVEKLEADIAAFNATLPALKEFILPGGGLAASHCHIARTVARRAARRSRTLAKNESVQSLALIYLNRLSDLLFVLARVLARARHGSEVLWNRARLD